MMFLKATRIAIGDAMNDWKAYMPALAKRVDNQIHIIYQRDFYPGTSLDAAGDCEATMNAGNSSDIVYVGVDTSIRQLPAFLNCRVKLTELWFQLTFLILLQRPLNLI